MFVTGSNHIHLTIQSKIGASHAQRRSPLSGAGLGGHALQPLLFGVIGLGHSGVQLVRAGGIASLKLVIDLRGSIQPLFQAIGSHQRRGAVHPVKIQDLLRDLDKGSFVVQLLRRQFVAEDPGQRPGSDGASRCGIERRCGLMLHVGPQIIPVLRHFGFTEINLVWDLFFSHTASPFSRLRLRSKEKSLCSEESSFFGTKALASAVPPKLAANAARSAAHHHAPSL